MIKDKAIRMRGVRTHNLKNIDLDLPLKEITCIGGPSGSGKSSLAFHTLMTESRRRFLNSLPNDIKFFWDIPGTIDVDELSPVLPVWVLPQNNPVVGSRQTVADLVGLSEKLEKLIFEMGVSICPHHKIPLKFNYEETEVEQGEGVFHIFLLADDYRELFGENSFPARTMSEASSGLHDFEPSDLYWEVYRTKKFERQKLDERIPVHFSGNAYLYHTGTKRMSVITRSKEWSCPKGDFHQKVKILSSYQLSALNASGACPRCEGHGMILEYDRAKLVKNDTLSLKEGAVSFLKYKRFEHLYSPMLKEAAKHGFDLDIPFNQHGSEIWNFLYEESGRYPGFNDLFSYLESKRYKANVRIFLRGLQCEVLCPECLGDRTSQRAKSLAIDYLDQFLHIGDFQRMSLKELLAIIKNPMFPADYEIVSSLTSLCEWGINIGLGHLNLLRKVKTVSPGEYQRLLLTKYLSYEGSGSLFVFDEPTVGLGKTEMDALWKGIEKLKEQGNTIVIVDHSAHIKKRADFYIEMGPAAGERGGEIIFQGKYEKYLKTHEAHRSGELPKFHTKQKPKFFTAKGIRVRELPKVDIRVAQNIPNLVFGPSGGGKTSYFIEGIANHLNKKITGEWLTGPGAEISSMNIPPQVEGVDIYAPAFQKFTSRSSVGTYLGISPYLRKHYSSLKVSKDLGLSDGHFSANSELGKCPRCDGKGKVSIDMSFLESIEMTCDECQGMKLRPFIATISDGSFSYHEAVNLPLDQLFAHMKLTPKLRKIRDLVSKLRLEYLNLDRTLESLSGGEKQRIRLLQGLLSSQRPSFLVLKNVSVGLSEHELPGVMEMIYALSESGHIVVTIDQNPLLRGLGLNEISVG